MKIPNDTEFFSLFFGQEHPSITGIMGYCHYVVSIPNQKFEVVVHNNCIVNALKEMAKPLQNRDGMPPFASKVGRFPTLEAQSSFGKVPRFGNFVFCVPVCPLFDCLAHVEHAGLHLGQLHTNNFSIE